MFGCTLSIRCSKLEQENIKLKLEKESTITSIENENLTSSEKVCQMEGEIEFYKHKVDSLEKVKQKIIIQKEYVVSETITEGVTLLKEHLK